MNNRFPKNVLQNLRLSFLTSKTLLDNGGASFVKDIDFTQPFEAENEKLCFDFLLERFAAHLTQTKSDDYYRDQIAKLTEGRQISSLSEYNKLNMYRLHLDERNVLQKNTEHLKKARFTNLNLFIT